MQPKPFRAISCFLLLLVCLCVLYYYKVLFMYPSFLHAWAQADRLSLAINFYDNGMDLFHPATFNLASPNGITGVEFPLQSYLAAAGGKIFGRVYISICFRLINLMMSLTGCLFLFAAAYKRTRSFVFSSITPLFFFCSPTFAYYSCNYLPDSFAASLCFIALYYVMEYLDKQRDKMAVTVIALLSLAALIKTSAVVYLAGFAGFVLIDKWMITKSRKLSDYLPLFASCIIGILVLSVYFLYSRYLNRTYGDPGIFLSVINPFQTFQEVRSFVHERLTDIWLKEYFLLPEYIILVALFIPALPWLQKNAVGRKQLLLMAILLPVALGVALLLGRQFVDHDYYVIAIFFPLVALVLLSSVVALHQQLQDISIKSVRSALAASMAVTCLFAIHHMRQRTKPFYQPFNIGYPWAMNGANILQKLNIPIKEHIVAYEDEEPNLALLYFDRKGYTNTRNTPLRTLEQTETFMKANSLHILVSDVSKKELMTREASVYPHFQQLYADSSKLVYRLRY